MTDEELVKRLRGWDHCWPAQWLEGAVIEAADRIEQIEQLEWELYICRMAQVVMDNGVAEVERLQAQNMRLSGMCYDLTAERDLLREATLQEAEKALRKWQDNLILCGYKEAPITVGMAADLVATLKGKTA